MSDVPTDRPAPPPPGGAPSDPPIGPQAGPLAGLTVLDLSRILAGPTCTQLLGDLGAEVIKVEKPGAGDDTRSWGPPYVADAEGGPTTESAYYLCANRNKRSVTLDIARDPRGQGLLRELLPAAKRADRELPHGMVRRQRTLERFWCSLGMAEKLRSRLYSRAVGLYTMRESAASAGPGPTATARAGYDYPDPGNGGIKLEASPAIT